jgi:hypothetical protein
VKQATVKINKELKKRGATTKKRERRNKQSS